MLLQQKTCKMKAQITVNKVNIQFNHSSVSQNKSATLFNAICKFERENKDVVQTNIYNQDRKNNSTGITVYGFGGSITIHAWGIKRFDLAKQLEIIMGEKINQVESEAIYSVRLEKTHNDERFSPYKTLQIFLEKSAFRF